MLCKLITRGIGCVRLAGPVTFTRGTTGPQTCTDPTLVPAFNDSFAEVRAKRRRVCAVAGGARSIGPTGPHAVIPNGIEPAESRNMGEPPDWFARLPRPRLLYAGSLDNRRGVDQVAEVAGASPHGSVVLVGPLQEAHFAAVREHPSAAMRAGARPPARCRPPHWRSRGVPRPARRQPADGGYEPAQAVRVSGGRPAGGGRRPPADRSGRGPGGAGARRRPARASGR